MDALILEVKTRGLYRYYPLEGNEISIGRALDNDIILSDSTVAPYHLKLVRGDNNELEIKNLATINASRFNGQLNDKLVTSSLPVDIELGRISARILSRSHKVPEARLLAGKGRKNHLFGHVMWAVLLLLACVLVSGIDYYFNAYTAIKWDELIKHVLRETLLSIAAFVVALSIIERLLVNRWEIKPVLLSVSLIYLLYHLMITVMAELQYIFSSSLPYSIFHLGWFLIIIPFAVTLYLTQITHIKRGRSILLALLISSPIAFPAIMSNSLVNDLTTDFRATAQYQKSLSPINWHLSPTISIEAFYAQTQSLESGEFAN